LRAGDGSVKWESRLSITETVLVFFGIPAGGFLLFAAMVFGPSATRQPRYRPGRPWTHEPVWFLPADEGHQTATHEAVRAIEAGPRHQSTAAGGATGEW